MAIPSNNIPLYEFSKSRLNYDRDTGIFTWKIKNGHDQATKTWNTRFAGKIAGTEHKHGYLMISIVFNEEKYQILLHRLAWFYEHFELPKFTIDHINQDKKDNKIANLRDVPMLLNHKNRFMTKANTSGVVGVCWCNRSEKWIARVILNKKKHWLGSYDMIEDAETVIKNFYITNGFTDLHGQKHTKE